MKQLQRLQFLLFICDLFSQLISVEQDKFQESFSRRVAQWQLAAPLSGLITFAESSLRWPPSSVIMTAI